MKILSQAGTYALAVFLVLSIVDGAGAQESVSVEARGGIAIPTSDLSDIADEGPSFGVGVSFPLNDRLAVRVDGDVDILSGKDASGPGSEGPDLNLYHYGAGLEYALVQPGGSRWGLDVNVGAGATTFDSDEFDVMGTPVDFSETYFTANGGLTLGYQVSPSVNVFVGGQAFVMFADEADTAVFAAISPEVDPAGFDTAVTIPVTAGVEIFF
ncbi:MAG: outer membrane beta-barrel protein [Gemmatimonadota bacterium]